MNTDYKEIIEFTLLFNRFKTKIFSYVLKMISDRMSAEDIVQNVFLKLFENIEKIKNRESIKYWIYTTARNEVFSYLRSRKTKKDQFNVEDIDGLEIYADEKISDTIEHEEFAEMLNRELELISGELKEVFVMKEFCGLSYREIAQLMGIDENLVKSRLFGVRQKLIKRLSNKINK